MSVARQVSKLLRRHRAVVTDAPPHEISVSDLARARNVWSGDCETAYVAARTARRTGRRAPQLLLGRGAAFECADQRDHGQRRFTDSNRATPGARRARRGSRLRATRSSSAQRCRRRGADAARNGFTGGCATFPVGLGAHRRSSVACALTCVRTCAFVKRRL